MRLPGKRGMVGSAPNADRECTDCVLKTEIEMNVCEGSAIKWFWAVFFFFFYFFFWLLLLCVPRDAGHPGICLYTKHGIG